MAVHRFQVLRWRWRRAWLVARLRWLARWHGAGIDAEVAPDVRLGRRLVLAVERRSTSVVRIGPRCRLGDGVVIDLRGGELVLGAAVDIRPGCVLGVAGRLELAGPNVIQRGCSFHCDERISVASRAVLSEGVTVVDSTHRRHPSDRWFLHNLATSPVSIGADAWIAAKATVARGVTVGDGAVVGANSAVVGDVAPGWLVSGVPAVPVGAAGPGERRPGTPAGPVTAPSPAR